jgi:peptidoglycan/LPS O-acetylase OafA/YrhL
MIEVSRYILALIVAQTHLAPIGTEWTGQVSVFGFYTLSGFLMTRVLNERYGFNVRGTLAFIVNRILRLWPAYLILMLLTFIALCFAPLSDFNPFVRFPSTSADVITNVFIIGQVTFDYVQWLPLAKPLVTSWSLSIELVSYLMLALYFAKSPNRLWVLIALGVAGMSISTWWCAQSANPAAYGAYCWQNRYGVVQAGFIPFAAGGLCYFHHKAIAGWLQRNFVGSIYLFVGACLIILICSPVMSNVSRALGVPILALFSGPLLTATVAPYLGIPLTWMLLSTGPGAAPSKVQDFFGRASYHLFISHMPIAAALAAGLHFRRVWLYPSALIVALCLSAFLVPLEHRINAIRDRVTRGAARRAA